MNEHDYDKLLNIKTLGKGSPDNVTHYFPYEPTPYEALEILVHEYEVKNSDYFVDFGCGLGRLNFFLHYHYHVHVTGIEMDELSYRKALKNKESYTKKARNVVERLNFLNCRAEEYSISDLDNRFYFFNPFSVHIFQHVLNRIILSYEAAPREIDIILYYPSEDYIFHMEKNTAFKLANEIVIPELYKKNQNERFLVYRLN